MKKLLSLSLMLSLVLATFTPALNAAQTQQMDLSTRQVLAKWWKGGRKMDALTPAEQQKLTALKRRIGIGAVIAAAAATAAVLGRTALKRQRINQIQQQRINQKAGVVVGYAIILHNFNRQNFPKDRPEFKNTQADLEKSLNELTAEFAITNPTGKFIAVMPYINEVLNRMRMMTVQEKRDVNNLIADLI